MKKMFLLFLSFSIFAQNSANVSEYTLAELEQMTKRERGQTKFATKVQHYYRSEMGAARSADAKGGNDREIQEADVFKVGPEGSKLLFLLNRYRGFQVISFKDGVSKASILGRLPIYNNYGSEMYYDETSEMVYVLNTEYSYSRNYWNSNYSTTIYQINVSDPTNPELVSSNNVIGGLSESRMVGNVLYVITQTWSYNDRKAMLTSFAVKDSKLTRVESSNLYSENSYVSTINVVKNNDKYYVLTARGNWSMSKGVVDVYDISSTEGKLNKLLTAKIKGRIAERSQLFIHKENLVTVSNFREERDVAKIAVEAFSLKKQKDPVSSSEKKTLILKDTNGLNANLQDVRVSGDLLYAFWVPANNIDPFDLVDMSDIENGFKYEGRLHFDGWISKAFPINYKGEKYVLGLGQVISPVGTSNTRYPQAKIFKINKINGKYKHQEVDTITIDSDKVWSNLNTQDKNFEFITTAKGEYKVLFPVTFRENGYKNGAKIINVNLNAGKVTEGEKLVGYSYYLKRIFLNKEIDKLNMFNDEKLTVLGNKTKKDGFLPAISVLELARNIIDFKVISETTGVQIIQNQNNIEFREVSLKNADAEKSDALKVVTVPGNFLYKKINSEEARLVVANFSKKYLVDNSRYDYKKDLEGIAEYTFDFSTFKARNVKAYKAEIKNINYYQTPRVLELDNSLLIQAQNTYLKLSSTLEILSVAKSCDGFLYSENQYSGSYLNKVSDKIIVTKSNEVKAKDSKEGKETFRFDYISELSVVGNKLVCGSAVNIAGDIQEVINDVFVTSSSTYGYYPTPRIGGLIPTEYDYYYNYSPEIKTYSFIINNGVATLSDKIDASVIGRKIAKNKFLTHDSSVGRFDVWSITESGEFFSKPRKISSTKGLTFSRVVKMNDKSLIVLEGRKNVKFMSIDNKYLDVKDVRVKSKFDKKLETNSSFIFDVRGVTLLENKAFVSQGYYGVVELELEF